MKLSFVIEAVDRATSVMRRVNSRLERMTAPMKRFGEQWKRLQEASGWNTFSARISSVAGTLRTGALYAAGFAAAGLYTLHSLSAIGDQAVNTAKRVGMTVEQVQRLNYAAEQNGANAGEMADGLKFLNRNAVAAATGSQETLKWFRRAGVAVKDANGKIRPTGALLADLSDKFASMPDGPKKTALAMALLGRSGEGLIPTLNLGRKGLDEMARKAEHLGVVLDKETAAGLDDLGDNMDDVGRASKGVLFAALKPLLPMLNQIAQAVSGWLVANRALIAGQITEVIRGMSEVLPQVWGGIQAVAAAVAWFAGVVNRIAQAIGGWQTVIVGVAAVLTGKLALALLATPVGWFVTAIFAIAALADLVIRNWEPIKAFFAGLWEGIVSVFHTSVATIEDAVRFLVNTVLFPFVQMLKLVNTLMPESMKGTGLGRATQGAVNWLDQPAQSPFGKRAAAGAQQIGGLIRVEIDNKGNARVRELKSETPGVDLEVGGYATVGAM